MSHTTESDSLYSELTYEQQLAYTQNTKQQILQKLATSNMDGTIPTDKESIELLMKVMDSMDRTTLSDKKNKIDTEGNVSTKELLGAMSQFIRQAKNSNPFAVAEGESLVGREPVVDDSDIPKFEFVEGEEVVGVVNETYNDFEERMSLIHDAELEAESKALGM